MIGSRETSGMSLLFSSDLYKEIEKSVFVNLYSTDGLEVPESCGSGASGGCRGLPGGSLRGHQPVRHPC